MRSLQFIHILSPLIKSSIYTRPPLGHLLPHHLHLIDLVVVVDVINGGWFRRRGQGRRRRRAAGVQGEDHVVRVAVRHHRGDERAHVRLRRRHLRRRDRHGRLPDQVLPVGVRAEAPREGEQLLQVRRPAAAAVHLVAVPRRAGRQLRGVEAVHAAGAAAHDAARVGVLPRRDGAVRRRGEPGDADRGEDLPRRRRRVRQPGGAAVPVGDRAGAHPRRAQHPLPARRHHRHPHRQRRQLLHLERPPEHRVEVLPRRRRRARGGAVPGLAGDHRDADEPRGARAARRRARHAGEDPRHARRRRRAGRDRARVRGGGGAERGGVGVPEAAAAGVEAAAGDRGGDAGVPAVHGDQRHHVLRARAVPDHGVQAQRVAALRRRHRRRQRRLHARLHRRRRQDRPPQAPPPGLRPNAHRTGNILHILHTKQFSL